MADVIDRIQRLRKIKERAAQMEWMASDADRRAQEQEVHDLEERIVTSQQTVDGMRLSSLVNHHRYIYSLEMRRRKEEDILKEIEQEVEAKRTEMQERALERRIIDAVAEVREEERRVEDKRKETRQLGEHGVLRWRRIRKEDR
jgi:flagellar export protein FliJ